MELMFVKSVNCGVDASRRANSVVINDAVGKPIRVCLKHVHGCLTEPSLKIIWIEQLRQSNFCQSTELQQCLCLPPSWNKFLSCIYRFLTSVATIVEVTSGTIDHEDASSSTPVAVTAVLHLGDRWKQALKLPTFWVTKTIHIQGWERILQLQWQRVRYF